MTSETNEPRTRRPEGSEYGEAGSAGSAGRAVVLGLMAPPQVPREVVEDLAAELPGVLSEQVSGRLVDEELERRRRSGVFSGRAR